MSAWCHQLLPGEVRLNPRGNHWGVDVGDLSPWAGFLLCSGNKELSLFFCSYVGSWGSESTEPHQAVRQPQQGLWSLTFSLSVAFFFFCFPGVSVTSSNTGVPDISGSVYNKTQVSNAGPSFLMA